MMRVDNPLTRQIDDVGASEDNWVRRLRGPERDAALQELRAVLVRGLSRSLAQRGGGEAFAEDVAQDALVRILDSLDTFSGRSRFTTWAMAVAMRVAISELRRRHFQDRSLDQVTGGEDLLFEIADADDTAPGDESERDEIINELRRQVDERLSPRQRTAVQAALSGMPVDEIARRMESNRNNVYKTIYDARQKLKQGLEAAGISAADVQAVLS